MWLFSGLNVFGISFFIFVLTLYFYLKHRYSYWSRCGVPQVPPTLLVGNLGPILRMSKCTAEVLRDTYNHPNVQNSPIAGIYVFHNPALLIRDPELIKRVLIKDFTKFCNRYSTSDVSKDLLGSKTLFFLRNPVWKEVRFKLTPFFSSGKLKHMFPLIDEVGQQLNKYLLQFTATQHDNSFELELKELCALYTTDVIATVAFGVEANSFKFPNGDFRRNGREIFRFNISRAISYTLIFFLPNLVPYFGIKSMPDEQIKFFRSAIKHILNEREKSGKSRNDLIDILIEFKNATKSETGKENVFKFEDDLLVAQAAIFFTAGFETLSTMSLALYEMARNPQIQEKLRQEIADALREHNGKITQQLIESMEYLQMIISETLRLYPSIPFLDRDCTIESDQTYSLEPFHKYGISKGMPIYISVYALHTDEKYFDQPLEFRPERFSAENRKSIIPYSYLPFGLGPHACIGERFSYLQVKIGLVHFLRNHRVACGAKTPLNIKLNPKALVLRTEEGIQLTVIRDPLLC